MMKPEKKNRLLSLVYLLIILICILAFVFLLLRYISARKELEKAQTEDNKTDIYVIPEEKNKLNFSYVSSLK